MTPTHRLDTAVAATQPRTQPVAVSMATCRWSGSLALVNASQVGGGGLEAAETYLT
jgi:hypothetical protein